MLHTSGPVARSTRSYLIVPNVILRYGEPGLLANCVYIKKRGMVDYTLSNTTNLKPANTSFETKSREADHTPCAANLNFLHHT